MNWKTACKIAAPAAACAGAFAFLVAPGRATRAQKAPFLYRNYAHRGLHTEDGTVPENSLPAFRAAAEAGYAVEMDVHLTADDQLVVFHDDTLERMCGVPGVIDDFTLAELRALRDLIAPPLTDERLETIGARVGSDVPFCVRGGTQLAEGRGERLTVLKNAPRLYAAVCKLDFPISTPALFQRSDRVALTDRPDTAAMLAALEAGDAAALCAKVKNVFEQVLPDEQRTRIEDIKHALLVHGAECAAMTGSRSAVFGLFREEDVCRAACGALRSTELQTFCTIFV